MKPAFRKCFVGSVGNIFLLIHFSLWSGSRHVNLDLLQNFSKEQNAYVRDAREA